MQHPRPSPRGSVLAAILLLSGACASSDHAASLSGADETPSAPGSAAGERPWDDAASTPDAHTRGDATAPGPAELPLHPPNVAHRTWLTLGNNQAAWVERGEADGPATIAVWDLTRPETPPVILSPAMLKSPRHLSIAGRRLAYSDDPFGDTDIFILELETGQSTRIAGGPGPQDRPHLTASHLTWQDCRGCPAGGGLTGQEIYLLPLSQSMDEDPLRVTADGILDRRPFLGSDGAGQDVLTWISGPGRVRFFSIGALADPPDLDTEMIHSLALVDGVLTARPGAGILNPDSMMPIILNPDSMIPSDPFRLDLSTGEALPLTVHAELRGDQSPRIAGAAGRVAWLQAMPENPNTSVVTVIRVDTGSTAMTVEAPYLQQLALGAHQVGAIGPSSLGESTSDVWLWSIPESSPQDDP